MNIPSHPAAAAARASTGAKHAVATAAISCTTRTLNRMRGVEDNGITELPNPIERPHIRNEVVIAKTDTSLGKDVGRASEVFEFIRNVSHIPRSEKLSLFHVYRSPSLRRGSNQVGLATQKSRDLQKINELAAQRAHPQLNGCRWSRALQVHPRSGEAIGNRLRGRRPRNDLTDVRLALS